jgi:hypothetical protein
MITKPLVWFGLFALFFIVVGCPAYILALSYNWPSEVWALLGGIVGFWASLLANLALHNPTERRRHERRNDV